MGWGEKGGKKGKRRGEGEENLREQDNQYGGRTEMESKERGINFYL